jgi:hypothetical protein
VFHNFHTRTQKLHAQHIGFLPHGVNRPHVHHAFQIKQSANGCRSHTVLPRARFRKDTRFSHVLGQQSLTERIVQLVRTRMQKVLPLEPKLQSPSLSKSSAWRKWRRPSSIVLE